MASRKRRTGGAESALDARDLRAVIDALPHGVTVQSPDGALVLANDAAARILGLASAEDVVRVGRDELIRRFEVLERPAAAPGAPVLVRWRVVATGEIRFSRVSSRPIHDARGRVVLTVNVFEDVTDERRALEALARGEARIETVLRSIADAVIATDDDGRIDFVNPALEGLLGVDAASVLGAPLGEVLRARTEAGEPLDVSAGSDAPRRAIALRPDGREVLVDLRATPVRDRSGAPVGTAILARDAGEDRRAERRTRLLAEAGAILASSLDYESTLRSVARLLVPQLADWCTIELATPDGGLEEVEIAHQDPAKVRWARDLRVEFPPDRSAPSGSYHVLRTGTPELVPHISDDLLVAAAKSPRQLELLRAIGFTSYMCVPLVARGRTIGVLSLIAAESRARFGPADLAFAQELAARAASAIENARQHREALAALAALQRLEAITSAALSSASVDDALHDVLERLAGSLGADLGVVLLLAPGGEALEVRAVQGLPRAPRAPIPRSERGWSWDVLESDTARIARRAEDVLAFRGVAEAKGIARVLSCPLRGGAGPIGVVHLASRRDDAFSAHEILLAQVAGERIAAVVDRLGIVESERRAREEAERANRLKDEFLAMVSHELRTPLNAVLGWIQILQARSGERELLERGLDRIARNGDALVRIVGDLIDVAQIMRGKLTMKREPVEIAATVTGAVDVLAPLAAKQGLSLDVKIAKDTGTVQGDPQRLQQVVYNLVANAVKFTPAGGKVRVRTRRRGGSIEIEVEDTGQGIRPDFLPFVFERFRQEDQGKTREHGGLGLGLAIVRHVVEQHGGEVTVTSDGPGQGALFRVRIPAS